MTAILETRALTMRFGGVIAVNAVDFSVGEGELRCVIGPNGAGKSTFFKCLTGQLRPTAGEIRFRGRTISGLDSHRIARLGIGIKTQVPNVFDSMTVADNVLAATARVSTTRAVARRRAEAALDRVGVTALAERKVGQLAHGQRQLVELAMVIAPDPDLILLDEPAAGMTDQEVTGLADLVVELAKAHAVVLVEHDMQFIRRIARTVTVFHQGAILAEGPVEQILDDARVRDVYLGKHAA
ncbi:MAG: ATP-binding cassette domain-containing protein [Alphaproteobacteria bacterium]